MAQSAIQKSHRRRAFTLTPDVIFAALAFAALVALSLFVYANPRWPVDLQITRDIESIHEPLFSAVMHIVGQPGYPPQVYLLVAFILVLFWRFGLKWEAVMHACATVGIGVVGYIPKILIARPRPPAELLNGGTILDGGTLSFPAGHVQSYVAIVGFLWFLSYTLLPKNSATRWIELFVYSFMLTFIGMSRVFLGEHWLTDVIGAYLLGFLWLWVTIRLYRSDRARRAFERRFGAARQT